MLEYRVRDIGVCVTFLGSKDMPLYEEKKIRNIHWNHNDTYNLVVYLVMLNNYDNK